MRATQCALNINLHIHPNTISMDWFEGILWTFKSVCFIMFKIAFSKVRVEK